MEAELTINNLNEDKNVYLSTLEKELEIIECMKKRKQLTYENHMNNYRELCATADALRQRIQELEKQIDYLMKKYYEMTPKPRFEYTIKEEVDTRITFKKILTPLKNSLSSNRESGM